MSSHIPRALGIVLFVTLAFVAAALAAAITFAGRDDELFHAERFAGVFSAV